MSSSSGQGVAQRVFAKGQEVMKEDIGKGRVLLADAAKSHSYIYPIRGMFYFATHSSLWKPLGRKILPTLVLSAAVVVGMFAFTYLPQLAVLVFVNGPLAVFTTVLLILSESSTIVNIISRNFLLQEALLDTFDGTLISKNETGVVKEGRQVKSGTNPIDRLGKILKSPFQKFTPKALVRYIMYLPLNFIPVIGTVLFILAQGRSRGQSVHDRYFQLKEWSAREKSAWLGKHVGAYTAFGTLATILEMIPFAGMFFAFTNTVGAALWAADIEQHNSQMGQAGQSTAPKLRAAAERAD